VGDLFSLLFGSILTVTIDEIYTSLILTLATLFFITNYYKEILSITFDEDFAKVTGINTNNMISIMTAITVVLTMKIVGILPISALLIFPALIAFQFARVLRVLL